MGLFQKKEWVNEKWGKWKMINFPVIIPRGWRGIFAFCTLSLYFPHAVNTLR